MSLNATKVGWREGGQRLCIRGREIYKEHTRDIIGDKATREPTHPLQLKSGSHFIVFFPPLTHLLVISLQVASLNCVSVVSQKSMLVPSVGLATKPIPQPLSDFKKSSRKHMHGQTSARSSTRFVTCTSHADVTMHFVIMLPT